jgi:hypothetical protein
MCLYSTERSEIIRGCKLIAPAVVEIVRKISGAVRRPITKPGDYRFASPLGVRLDFDQVLDFEPARPEQSETES